MSDLNIRWVHHADLPRILTLERLSFGAPLDSARALERFMLPAKVPTCIYLDPQTNAGLVAEVNGSVVGFLLFQVDWLRASAAIVRLVVLCQKRRRGVASALVDSMRAWVDYMQKRLVWQGFDLPNLDFSMQVPERDLISQLFLRARDFQCVRVVRSAEDGGEDSYLFRLTRSAQTSLGRKPWFCEQR